MSMWALSLPWWEIFARAVFIYFVVFVLFRWIGKRQLGEMAPFDFVLLLIMSESVSKGLTAEENSLTGAAISVATLIGISRIIDLLSYRSGKIESLMEGEPQFVIIKGDINEKVLKKERITRSELDEALREKGIQDIHDVDYAVLETNGTITTIKRKTA